MSELVVVPCDQKAATYAVMNWHYSRKMPVGKLITFGVWENQQYVGCVIYGRGATPNLLKPYGLDQTQGCELVRIAMRDHVVPVSKVVAISLRGLVSTNPGLRLVVSFADPSQNHHGGIYQAGNWIYTGKSSDAQFLRNKQTGQLVHPRTEQAAKSNGRPMDLSKFERVNMPGKHRYLYPLDKAMRRKIERVALPYPRGSSLKGETSDFRSERPGSIPGNRSKTTN